MTVEVELKVPEGSNGKIVESVIGEEPIVVKVEQFVIPEQVTVVVATFAKVLTPEK